MASLFRPVYTVLDKRTGKRVKRRSRKWWGKYRGEDGKEHRIPLETVSKAAAAGLLAEAVRDGGDRYGRQRRRPLEEHLAEWEAVLAGRGNTADYVRTKLFRVRALAAALGWGRLGDVEASGVERQLAVWRATRRRFSVQTSNFYLDAVKSFCRWCVLDRRARDNPLLHLAGGNVRLDRRQDRRDLSDADLLRLLDATRAAGKVRRKLPAEDRALLYLAALYTGLRASELASLTPGSFDLDAPAPTVTVAAAYDKRRRADTLPLHRDFAARLRPWLAGRPAGQPLWPGKWASQKTAGRILKADLAAAGVPYADADGRRADFHALRHTFITRLVRAGVPPKEAQLLARHSTVKLTLDRYTHARLADIDRAVNLVPNLVPGPRTPGDSRGQKSA